MSAPPFLLSPHPLLIKALQTNAACRHHWLVASLPVAALYPARCRRCGAQRTFPCLDPAIADDDFRGALDGPALRPPLSLGPHDADAPFD